MEIYLTTVIIFISIHSTVLLQTTKSSKDVQDTAFSPPTKIPSIDYISTPDSWDANPDLKSLWVYRPASLQSNPADMSRHVILKQPHILTRLAKPLTFGFDPFFNKGYFEPFERRQKPVTLVAFRKNGQVPRKTIRVDQKNPTSDEVAEMQSSFNDVSSFWHDTPGQLQEIIMDAAIALELEEYTSSSDEADTPQHPPPPGQKKSPNDPDFKLFLNKKAERREKEMKKWFTYMRAYVPLMKLMLEEYKIKWESCQFRKYAKDHNPDSEDMDDDSDTSNGSVTSCIDMGFPNGDMERSPEIGSGRGNIRPGLYMFLSYIRGGWLYPEVKQFFRQELGVRCFRTPATDVALKGPADFRALMKFKSAKARADVFLKLSERDMLRNFTYVCVDADEDYFNDSVVANLRNTKGFIGLPRFSASMRN